jgi:hypothetical protein
MESNIFEKSAIALFEEVQIREASIQGFKPGMVEMRFPREYLNLGHNMNHLEQVY